MGLIITILPVVTKDLPIFPRFKPCEFLSRCKFSNFTIRHLMVEFYLRYSRSHAFRYERKNTNPTLVRIEPTTYVLAGVQVTTVILYLSQPFFPATGDSMNLKILMLREQRFSPSVQMFSFY